AAEWDARIWQFADGAFGAGFRSLLDLTLSSLAAAGAHLGVQIDAAAVCADVDRADLDALLDHPRISVAAAVSSEEVRAYKPRPEPFRRTSPRAGPRVTSCMPTLTDLLPHLGIRQPTTRPA